MHITNVNSYRPTLVYYCMGNQNCLDYCFKCCDDSPLIFDCEVVTMLEKQAGVTYTFDWDDSIFIKWLFAPISQKFSDLIKAQYKTK